MIEPKYLTFEQAKWLKEKGWNQHTISFWKNPNGTPSLHTGVFYYNNRTKEDGVELPAYSAPEQWQLVEWLRVNHRIDIFTPKIKGEYFYDIWKDMNEVGFYNERIVFSHKKFKRPQEAYSAAFDWIKDNNLI
jgi:hypothetical protein